MAAAAAAPGPLIAVAIVSSGESAAVPELLLFFPKARGFRSDRGGNRASRRPSRGPDPTFTTTLVFGFCRLKPRSWNEDE